MSVEEAQVDWVRVFVLQWSAPCCVPQGPSCNKLDRKNIRPAKMATPQRHGRGTATRCSSMLSGWRK